MGAQTKMLALSFDFSERRSRSRSQFFFGAALVKSGALQYSGSIPDDRTQ